MAFIQVQFYSETLNVSSTVNVLLPEMTEEADTPPRVLYLLHGYSDDQSAWTRRTSVERYAEGHNLAVIMPAVNHSFYCNERSGERYWDYVSNELPRVMHRFFRLSERPEDTFVAGLSMGGYGAMKLALTYPERFAAAGCFSGTLDLASRVIGDVRFPRIFGDVSTVAGSEDDLFHLMAEHADAPRKPRLFIACGTADFLYGHYRKFIPAIRAHGWPTLASEQPNAAHSWDYWDTLIARFIPWALEEEER